MGQIVLKFPSHLRIEITQGCTRKCYSCPVSPNKKDWKFMEPRVFHKLLSQLDDRVKRVEFSMHGEPLLNSNIGYYIYLLRRKLPKVQISIISNTDPLWLSHVTFERLIEFFDHGLNFLHADVYSKIAKNNFLSMIAENREKLKEHGIKAQRFVKGGINIWGYHGGKEKYILMSDESLGFNVAEKHIIRNIHTWAGNLPYDRWKTYGLSLDMFPMNKKCTEPMKCAPFDIHGNMTLCCADSAKSIVYGNIFKETIEEIWQGERIQKVRCFLSQGHRDFIPACYFCNRPSFRVGLWPYKGPVYRAGDMMCSKISDNLKDLFRRKNELSQSK